MKTNDVYKSISIPKQKDISTIKIIKKSIFATT